MQLINYQPAPMSGDLLSVPEVATLFHLSVATIYRMVESRKIPFYRLGGTLRFSRREVEEYLHQQWVPPIRLHERR